MQFTRFAFALIPILTLPPLHAFAQDAAKVRSSTATDQCACPKEGEWKAQNLEGWMNCTGPLNIKRTLREVKDEGTIWILEDDCSRVFGEASRKKDEDILLERTEDCGFAGTINGEEDGVNMSIDVVWTLDGEEFIGGEMHAEPSLQGMMCEYFRPYEITYEKPIDAEDYDKRREAMLKKLEKIEGNR